MKEEYQELLEEFKEIGNVSSMLSFMNLSLDCYISYIKCIYYIFFSSGKIQVCVRTDGTENMAKRLLYLAYQSVPYSLRSEFRPKILKNADDNPGNHLLLFTNSIPRGKLYVDPLTGENNILNKRYEKRLERNEFTTYFVEHYQEEEKNIQLYNNMEEWLNIMGKSSKVKMSSYDLAYEMCCLNKAEDLSDANLFKMLYGWMNLPLPNSEIS